MIAQNLLQTENKNLLTKVDLWKSMSDFLGRSLKREKVKFKKIEDAFVLAKISSMKKNEIDRANTDSELSKLKLEVDLIKENASKNAKDAERMIIM